MAISSSLTVSFSNGVFARKVDLLFALLRCNWSPLNPTNKICYFFQNDDCDMYEWNTTTITKEEFFAEISKKNACDTMLGVELYWNNSDIGITCIISKPEEVLFSLNINRMHIDAKDVWSPTDMSWYVIHIIQPLVKMGINIVRFSFEDILC